jgi:hypothetical protein
MQAEILNEWFNGQVVRKGMRFVPDKFKVAMERIHQSISYHVTGEGAKRTLFLFSMSF